MKQPLRGRNTAFSTIALVSWTVAMALSCLWNISQEKATLKAIALHQAIQSLEKDIIYRRWGALHGGVYVPATPATPPNPYLNHLPERDIVTPSGRQLTLLNPAYMTRQVFELGRESAGMRGHITSLNPIRKENLPDPWERTALQLFSGGTARETSSIEELDGKPYMRYMRALVTEAGCMKCHAAQGYTVGDIRGGISVSIPLAPLYAESGRHQQTIVAGHLAVWLLGGGLMLLARTRLQKSWQNEVAARQALESSQKQLFQQEKMASIGQLAAGVAHEINNPMGFITSNLGTLSKYAGRLNEYIATAEQVLKSGEDRHSAVETLAAARTRLKIDRVISDITQLVDESLDGASRVRRIVQDLKSFSRVDQAESALVNLNEALETTINIAWNEIKYVAAFNREFGEIPAITCHPQQLNQVFLNLLVNAGHALEGINGSITVRTWGDADNVFVAVSDSGKGIPPENLTRIFEPFFTTKEVGKGTGLGLSISYEIVKKHGGEISVESTVGVGTTFTVRLPVSGPPPEGNSDE